MRLKARSLNILTEDYKTDKIEDVSQVYNGSRVIEGADSKHIDLIYSSDGIKKNILPNLTDPLANENFIFRNDQKSVLATYDPFEKKIIRVNKTEAYGISPRNAEQSFALQILLNQRIQLVSLSGKAGRENPSCSCLCSGIKKVI